MQVTSKSSVRLGARKSGFVVLLAVGLLSLSAPKIAAADILKTGSWPTEERVVALDVKNESVEDVLEQLARKAGWSLVLPEGLHLGRTTVHIRDAKADQVLQVLLMSQQGTIVVAREGNILRLSRGSESAGAGSKSVERATPATVAADVQGSAVQAASRPAGCTCAPGDPLCACLGGDPNSDASSAEAGEAGDRETSSTSEKTRGGDRNLKGQDLRIEAGETVADVSVIGGSVEVLGTVTGDLVVTGGSARVKAGGHIHGDVSALGGSIFVEDNGRIDGDVTILGGSLEKSAKAQVRGDVSREQAESEQPSLPLWHRVTNRAGDALSSFAALFVLGAVLLALTPRRMETLREEILARPMRVIALGIVGSAGFIAACTLLCVTLIGIPVALTAFCLGALAMLAGAVSAAQLSGELLIRHRTHNPYAHLALGCALVAGVGAIPFFGPAANALIVLIGVGAVVATRIGGLLVRSTATAIPSEGPYRSTGG